MDSKDYLRYAYKGKEIVGVRLSGMGESFTVSLYDGVAKGYTQADVIRSNKPKTGVAIPNKKQATLMCTVMNDLNLMLEKAGGQIMSGWYWTSEAYDVMDSWAFNGDHGVLDLMQDTRTLAVRFIAIHQ